MSHPFSMLLYKAIVLLCSSSNEPSFLYVAVAISATMATRARYHHHHHQYHIIITTTIIVIGFSISSLNIIIILCLATLTLSQLHSMQHWRAALQWPFALDNTLFSMPHAVRYRLPQTPVSASTSDISQISRRMHCRTCGYKPSVVFRENTRSLPLRMECDTSMHLYIYAHTCVCFLFRFT